MRLFLTIFLTMIVATNAWSGLLVSTKTQIDQLTNMPSKFRLWLCEDSEGLDLTSCINDTTQTMIFLRCEIPDGDWDASWSMFIGGTKTNWQSKGYRVRYRVGDKNSSGNSASISGDWTDFKNESGLDRMVLQIPGEHFENVSRKEIRHFADTLRASRPNDYLSIDAGRETKLFSWMITRDMRNAFRSIPEQCFK